MMKDADGGSRPVPDPTLLTTEQLNREINSLREVLQAELLAQRERVEARLDGMDKAIALREHMVDKQPALVDAKLEALKTLFDERFRSIALQFAERDVRTEQTSRDSKVAVDAALQAAKEAVAEQNRSSALAISKSEAATMKQIDQMGTLIGSTVGGINTSISDAKERLTRIEGEARGKSTEDTTHRSISANTVGIAGLVIGSLIGLGGLLVSFLDHSAGSVAAMSYPVSAAAQPTPVPQIIYVPIPPPQGAQQAAPK